MLKPLLKLLHWPTCETARLSHPGQGAATAEPGPVAISATHGEGRAGGTQVGGSVAGIMHPTF